jgi:hypothetical protein
MHWRIEHPSWSERSKAVPGFWLEQGMPAIQVRKRSLICVGRGAYRAAALLYFPAVPYAQGFELLL